MRGRQVLERIERFIRFPLLYYVNADHTHNKDEHNRAVPGFTQDKVNDSGNDEQKEHGTFFGAGVRLCCIFVKRIAAGLIPSHFAYFMDSSI